MVDTLAAFESKMAGWQTSIEQAKRVGIFKAAAASKQVINAQIAKATGGDMRLSGTAGSSTKRASGNVVSSKSAPQLGAMYRTSGESAIVRAFGPVQLIEGDTKPHVIGSRHAGSGKTRAARLADLADFGASRGGRKAVLHWGGFYAKYVNSPGTKGKHPWEHGVQEAEPVIAKIMSDEQDKALRSVFR